MSFRPDRRRRLMGDDGLSAAPADDQQLPVRGGRALRDDQTPRRAFAPAAEEALARPIRDFLPSSYAAVALAAAAGLLPIGAIVLAHLGSARAVGFFGVAGVGLFDLASPGNASGWFAAMLMAAAGLVATFIYSLRRHRVDDYHGRYRVWIWTAVACLVVSLGEATSLAALVRGLSHRAALACGASEAVVWPAVLGVLLSVAGLRLLVEIRCSRGAVALWTLAVGAFLLAAATNHGWLIHVPETNRLLVERGSWLAGYVTVLATFLLYARHVALQIEGKIAVVPAKLKPPKARKKKYQRFDVEEAAAGPTRAPSSNVRTDLEPVADTPRATHEESQADDNGQPGRPLSKKERRRLRREARVQAQSS